MVLVSFEEILDQEKPKKLLLSLLKSRRLPPALLFSGLDGIGKKFTALKFAKALNCDKKTDCCRDPSCPSCRQADKSIHGDIHLVNLTYQANLLGEDLQKQRTIKISTLRHVSKDLEMRSLSGGWKVAIIESAHLMQTAAANSILKSLEEPPPRTLWILITSKPTELLATIRSRCQNISFRPLPARTIEKLLKGQGTPPEIAKNASQSAEGSLQKAYEFQDEPLKNPSDWLSDPLAPFELADCLPRELHMARPLVERHLTHMSWYVRNLEGPQGFRSAKSRNLMRKLSTLSRCLNSNADPRLVLELAALGLQKFNTSRLS